MSSVIKSFFRPDEYFLTQSFVQMNLELITPKTENL